MEIDNGKSRMGGKIREAREKHIPFMLIVGDKDIEAGGVSVRLRTVFDLARLGEVFPIHDSVEEAKAALTTGA